MSRPRIKIRSRPIKLGRRQRRFLGLALIVLVAALSLAWQATNVGWFSRELKVWVFDVGQGDAIFIETPEGEQILIDAGADRSILSKLGQVMLPWDRTIDKVFITHPHTDHEGGLPDTLRRYQVSIIYKTGALGSEGLQETVHELAARQGTEIALASEGALFLFTKEGVGGRLEILAPDSNLQNKKVDNLNAASIVLLLTYGKTSILLTGDAPIDEEEEILNDITDPVDVLKAAHHGSATSTSRSFLEVVSPRYAVISVGEGNDYGHPHPATLERLRARGIRTFRTDLDGDILITSTGGEPVVESRPLPF